MNNYRSFTKMECVVNELQKELTTFDSSILSGVRGLSQGEYNNRVIIPYSNCEYLGELAERCEERGLAKSTKDLRSILMAFVMETTTTRGEDFLYNQFEIFERIYKKVTVKDYSLLDEILLKKCKSQISKNKADFELDYDIFDEVSFSGYTLEEQTLSILALSAYKSCIYNEESIDKYNDLFTRALKVFYKNNKKDFKIVSYISLSHIYDMIVDISKEKKITFSKIQKDFYKFIKEVTTSDLTKILEAYGNSYDNEHVEICGHFIEFDKLMDISYISTTYNSTEMLLKKPITTPAKCRKIGKSFNYSLTKGQVDISKIKQMKTLYDNQNKEFYFKHLLDYIDFTIIDDIILYCTLFAKLEKCNFNGNIIKIAQQFDIKTNMERNQTEILKYIFELYDNGNLEKISKLYTDYLLFNLTLKLKSTSNLKALKILYQVERNLPHTYFSLSDNQIQLLLRNNCIDEHFNITIDDVSIAKLDWYKERITSCAWKSEMYELSIKLARNHPEALDKLMGELDFLKKGYYSYNHVGYETHIDRTLKKVKDTSLYNTVFDFFCELTIRSQRSLSHFIKTYFDDVIKVYEYTDEEKDLLTKELISENINIDKKLIEPDTFLIDTVGIDNAFKLLDISNEDAFNIKKNYIQVESSRSYISSFTERCIEVFSNSFSEEDLLKVEISKQKAEICNRTSSKYDVITDIRYFEKNKDIVLNHCIEELKAYLEFALDTFNLYNNSALYMYFKSKEIPEIEDILEKLQQKILEICTTI